MSRNICLNICEHDARFTFKAGAKIGYRLGFKKCAVCEKSILTNLILCPCCHTRLRYRASSRKHKAEAKRY